MQPVLSYPTKKPMPVCYFMLDMLFNTRGLSKIPVKTVDSDIVVIIMYAFCRLLNLDELCLEYGIGKHLLPSTMLQRKVPQGIPELLPFFHAFRGADTASSIAGIGKSISWNIWIAFRDVYKCFFFFYLFQKSRQHH